MAGVARVRVRVRASRAVLTAVAVLLPPLVAVPSAVATPAPAAPPPAVWTNVGTPPMSGDTSQKVYNDVAIVRGGGVFATGYTRHDLPGASEVRTLVERNTGAGWVAMDTPDVETTPAADYMYGVAGTSATDVWAVGRSATGPGRPQALPYAIHWDGTSWTRVTVPDPSGGAGADMSEVVAIRRNDVWAVGTAYPLNALGAAYHWDGRAWSSVRLPLFPGCLSSNYTELTALTATPSGEVYAGGDCPTRNGYAGFVVKMNSLSSWTVVARVGGRSNVADLTSAADGTVWATGTRTTDAAGSRPYLLSGSGTAWTLTLRPPPPAGTSESANGVAVTPTGVTIVGERNTRDVPRAPFAATWDGARWLRVTIPAPDPTSSWMSAVAGTAAGPVWAMGQYLDSRARIVGFASTP